MASWKRSVVRIALAIATAVLLTGRAEANPIGPDLTLFDLDLSYAGSAFSVTSPFLSVMSWTSSNAGPAGVTIGDVNLSWNGLSGTLSVFDLIGNVQLLSGTITKFSPQLFAPGAAFVLDAVLSSNGLGLGNNVRITIGSNNFSNGTGSGQADITSIPEPATLSLALAGLGLAVVRRRARHSLS